MHGCALYSYIHQDEGKEPTMNTQHTTTATDHIFTITDDHGTAATLEIEATHGMIMNIEVREDRRGEGLARHLYETAVDTLPAVYHVPTWGCTPEGAAFAEAVGGEVMDDETAAEITGFDLALLDFWETEYAA